MTVKIDKYKLKRNDNGNYWIVDCSERSHPIICEFSTDTKTNKALAEACLNELNTGKFENYISKRSDDD